MVTIEAKMVMRVYELVYKQFPFQFLILNLNI